MGHRHVGGWVVGGPQAWGGRGRPPGESNLAPNRLPTPASGTPFGTLKHPRFLLGSPGLTSQTPSLPTAQVPAPVPAAIVSNCQPLWGPLHGGLHLSTIPCVPRPRAPAQGTMWQPPQWSQALPSLASHHHVGVPMLDTEDPGQMQRPWPALGDTLGYKVSSGWPLRRWIKRMVTLVLAGCWGLPERLWTMSLSLMGRRSTHTHRHPSPSSLEPCHREARGPQGPSPLA